MLLVWVPAFEKYCFRALSPVLKGCLSDTVLRAENVPRQTLTLRLLTSPASTFLGSYSLLNKLW